MSPEKRPFLKNHLPTNSFQSDFQFFGGVSPKFLHETSIPLTVLQGWTNHWNPTSKGSSSDLVETHHSERCDIFDASLECALKWFHSTPQATSTTTTTKQALRRPQTTKCATGLFVGHFKSSLDVVMRNFRCGKVMSYHFWFLYSSLIGVQKLDHGNHGKGRW